MCFPTMVSLSPKMKSNSGTLGCLLSERTFVAFAVYISIMDGRDGKRGGKSDSRDTPGANREGPDRRRVVRCRRRRRRRRRQRNVPVVSATSTWTRPSITAAAAAACRGRPPARGLSGSLTSFASLIRRSDRLRGAHCALLRLFPLTRRKSERYQIRNKNKNSLSSWFRRGPTARVSHSRRRCL